MGLGRLTSGGSGESNADLRCSFCQKRHDEVRKLISSPSYSPRVYICDECIRVCRFILKEDTADAPETDSLQKRD